MVRDSVGEHYVAGLVTCGDQAQEGEQNGS